MLFALIPIIKLTFIIVSIKFGIYRLNLCFGGLLQKEDLVSAAPDL